MVVVVVVMMVVMVVVMVMMVVMVVMVVVVMVVVMQNLRIFGFLTMYEFPRAAKTKHHTGLRSGCAGPHPHQQGPLSTASPPSVSWLMSIFS